MVKQLLKPMESVADLKDEVAQLKEQLAFTEQELVLADMDTNRAEEETAAMRKTLTKIAEAPEGVWSRDLEEYLTNVIEWCQEEARVAIAEWTEDTDEFRQRILGPESDSEELV